MQPIYPASTWRLIKTEPANGAWNMAFDEAILEAVAAGLAPATLRLYAWEPACLSLGRAQPFTDVDPARIATAGVHLVRRITGGRAKGRLAPTRKAEAWRAPIPQRLLRELPHRPPYSTHQWQVQF